MDCAEVRRSFTAGHVPSGPQLAAHLEVCTECRELLENDGRLGLRLGAGVGPEVDPGELFGRVEAEVARDVGPRARLRALPTGIRGAILSAVAGLLLVSQLVLRPRANLETYSPLVFWLTALLLAAAISLGALRLLRGPGAPLAVARRERLLPLVLLGAPLIATLLAPLGSAEAAGLWGHPGRCFVYGAVLTLPVVISYWLFERRDAPPATALLSAGALAGAAANLLLHGHCPSAHPGHLLVGHVSIGVVWAAALWLLRRPAQPAR